MPNPPVVPSQKNSWVIGFHPASAYSRDDGQPGDALHQRRGLGDVVAPVRPSAAGSTFSRPSANM